MVKDIPKELEGDLAGWRFTTVYEVYKPCRHGACCEIAGYFLDRKHAVRVVKRFRQRGEKLSKFITNRTVLTRDGRTGILLAIGVSVFHRKVEIKRTRKPKGWLPPGVVRSRDFMGGYVGLEAFHSIRSS